jgi:putative ABC transporter-associated repeat protein
MPRMSGALLGAALVLALLSPLAVHETRAATRVQAGEPTAAERVVIADGHVDVGPRFLNGRWRMQVRDDSVRPSVWRDPSDVVLRVLDAARVTVPGERAFRFLGAPGATVWLLPQVQRAGVLWPGWNTQDREVAATIRREASWTLHGVEGPGRFLLFSNGAFGAPEVLFDSGRPHPQQVGIEADTHVHGNWAFTRRGGYRLDVAMSATTRAGETVSDRGVLRFFVGAGGARRAFAATASTTTKGREREAGGTPLGTVALVAAAAVVLVVALGVRRAHRHA